LHSSQRVHDRRQSCDLPWGGGRLAF
jgi:hypothetical protein